jgi:acetyltransferase
MGTARNGAVMSTALATAPRMARFPSSLIDRLPLADGREVVIRPVLGFDAPAEQDFFSHALSAHSRLRRFHFGLKELPTAMLRAMTEVDHDLHVAIVAEAFDAEDQPRIVADARYVRGPGPDEAEFAVAVADDWQGAGLGRELMQRLACHAERRGVKRLIGEVMQGNAAMFSVASALGAQLEPSPQGAATVRVRIELAPCRR